MTDRELPAGLTTLLNRAHDAACVTTPGGEVVAWNHAAERLLGKRAGEAHGRAIGDVLGIRESNPDATEAWHPPLPNGFDHTFEVHARARGGRAVWLAVTAFTVDPPGAQPMVVYLFQDVTRHKELLRELHEHFAARGHRGPLTSREREVLRAMAAGLGTEAIAERLRVSRATIRNHAQNIFGKLEVHTRLEAVLVAARRGLL
jgi:PAS domain S-box-containing protein